MTVYELIQQLTRYDAGTDVKFVAFTNPHTHELEDFDGEEIGVATVPGRQLDMHVKSIHEPATEGGPAYIRLEEVNS